MITKLLLPTVLSEDCITPEEILMRQGRRAEHRLAFRLYAAYHSGLCCKGGIVGNDKVSCYAHLATYDTMLTYLCGAGYARLGRHYGVLPYFHIMGNLAEIVDLDPLMDYRGSYL